MNAIKYLRTKNTSSSARLACFCSSPNEGKKINWLERFFNLIPAAAAEAAGATVSSSLKKATSSGITVVSTREVNMIH